MKTVVWDAGAASDKLEEESLKLFYARALYVSKIAKGIFSLQKAFLAGPISDKMCSPCG